MPQVREAGWFVTGRDGDPRRHVFVRLEERMDGSGTWTLELHLCGVAGEAGRAMQTYVNESDALAALKAIYRLSRHLDDLPTWDPSIMQPGRWRTLTRPPTPQDLQFRQRHRHGRRDPSGRPR